MAVKWVLIKNKLKWAQNLLLKVIQFSTLYYRALLEYYNFDEYSNRKVITRSILARILFENARTRSNSEIWYSIQHYCQYLTVYVYLRLCLSCPFCPFCLFHSFHLFFYQSQIQSSVEWFAQDFCANYKAASKSEVAQPKLTKLGININLPKVYLTLSQNPTSASKRPQRRPFSVPRLALWKWPCWGCVEAEAGFLSVV